MTTSSIYRAAYIILLLSSSACAWNTILDRRDAWKLAGSLLAGGESLLSVQKANAAVSTSTVERLEQSILKQPPVSSASELNGIDNTYFPDFLEGTWDLTQTLVNVSAPIGLMFIGGPNGIESIAERSMAESRERLNIPVQLAVRYVPTKWGVAEDRVFNTQQRLDAFAGRKVVASVSYADVGGSNRASVLAMGGSATDPLQTTFIRFKGPAAQKTFVTNHGSQWISETSWVGWETQRSIFALTNENTAPPIFTDTELLWRFDKLDESTVQGRLRIAGYLNPNDKLYFEARNRAVSLQDYTLEMKKSA